MNDTYNDPSVGQQSIYIQTGNVSNASFGKNSYKTTFLPKNNLMIVNQNKKTKSVVASQDSFKDPKKVKMLDLLNSDLMEKEQLIKEACDISKKASQSWVAIED